MAVGDRGATPIAPCLVASPSAAFGLHGRAASPKPNDGPAVVVKAATATAAIAHRPDTQTQLADMSWELLMHGHFGPGYVEATRVSRTFSSSPLGAAELRDLPDELLQTSEQVPL